MVKNRLKTMFHASGVTSSAHFRPKIAIFGPQTGHFRRISLAKHAKGAKRLAAMQQLLRELGVLGERRLPDRSPSSSLPIRAIRVIRS